MAPTPATAIDAADESAMSPLDLPVEQSWRQLAACRTMDPALFYPEADIGPGKAWRTMYPQEARDACDRCPVRSDCLAHALEANEIYGFWGGKAPTERKRMKGGLADCRACGDQFVRHHGGLRYCQTCRPELGCA